MTSVIERIKAHRAVEGVSDERGMRDGFWVYLKDGWVYDNPGEHAIHEDSPSECLKMLKHLMVCECSETCINAAKARATEGK